MAFQPMPHDLMRRGGLFELLPEFDILDRLFIGRAPAVLLPAREPGRDAAAQIGGIRIEIDSRKAAVKASSARIAAVSSMRLLVVAASPPESSLRCSPKVMTAPQPPGPGLPEQAPSVQIVTFPLNAPIRDPARSSSAGESAGA